MMRGERVHASAAMLVRLPLHQPAIPLSRICRINLRLLDAQDLTVVIGDEDLVILRGVPFRITHLGDIKVVGVVSLLNLVATDVVTIAKFETLKLELLSGLPQRLGDLSWTKLATFACSL